MIGLLDSWTKFGRLTAVRSSPRYSKIYRIYQYKLSMLQMLIFTISLGFCADFLPHHQLPPSVLPSSPISQQALRPRGPAPVSEVACWYQSSAQSMSLCIIREVNPTTPFSRTNEAPLFPHRCLCLPAVHGLTRACHDYNKGERKMVIKN